MYLTLLSESAVHNHHQFYCVNKKSPPKLYNALAVNNNTATRVDHVHYSLSFSGLPHLIIITTQCVACLLQVSHFSRSHYSPSASPIPHSPLKFAILITKCAAVITQTIVHYVLLQITSNHDKRRCVAKLADKGQYYYYYAERVDCGLDGAATHANTYPVSQLTLDSQSQNILNRKLRL